MHHSRQYKQEIFVKHHVPGLGHFWPTVQHPQEPELRCPLKVVAEKKARKKAVRKRGIQIVCGKVI